jgi:hypothetical protein
MSGTQPQVIRRAEYSRNKGADPGTGNAQGRYRIQPEHEHVIQRNVQDGFRNHHPQIQVGPLGGVPETHESAVHRKEHAGCQQPAEIGGSRFDHRRIVGHERQDVAGKPDSEQRGGRHDQKDDHQRGAQEPSLISRFPFAHQTRRGSLHGDRHPTEDGQVEIGNEYGYADRGQRCGAKPSDEQQIHQFQKHIGGHTGHDRQPETEYPPDPLPGRPEPVLFGGW